MKKKTLLLFALLALTTLVFGQSDSTVTMPEDPTNDWADWVSRIMAAVGILWGGYQQFMSKAGRYGNKAIDLFGDFVNMVESNDFSPTSLRNLAAKGKDLPKKID